MIEEKIFFLCCWLVPSHHCRGEGVVVLIIIVFSVAVVAINDVTVAIDDNDDPAMLPVLYRILYTVCQFPGWLFG